MSEFTLPANSKVGEGKHWALPQPAKHVKSFRIYRWDPAKKANPTLDTFEIDRDHCGPMVLDALVKINDQIDPTVVIPAVVPRRRVRLLRDEHRRHEHARLPDAHGQPARRAPAGSRRCRICRC